MKDKTHCHYSTSSLLKTLKIRNFKTNVFEVLREGGSVATPCISSRVTCGVLGLRPGFSKLFKVDDDCESKQNSL